MKFRRFICRKQAERAFTPPTEQTDSEKHGPLGPAVTASSRSTESQTNTLTTEQLNQNRSQAYREKANSLALVSMTAHNSTADSGSNKAFDWAGSERSVLVFSRQSDFASHVNNPSCEPTDSDIDTPKRKGSGKLLEDPFHGQESSLVSSLRQSETSSDGETLNCDLDSEGSTQFAVIGREADTSSSEDNSDDGVDDDCDDYHSDEWHLFLRSFGSCGGAALIGKANSQNAMS